MQNYANCTSLVRKDDEYIVNSNNNNYNSAVLSTWQVLRGLPNIDLNLKEPSQIIIFPQLQQRKWVR